MDLPAYWKSKFSAYKMYYNEIGCFYFIHLLLCQKKINKNICTQDEGMKSMISYMPSGSQWLSS